MRRYILAVGIVVVSASAVVRAGESLTVGAAAVGFTPASTYANKAKGCVARLETAQIRFWTDGTIPTAATGILLEVGDVLNLSIDEARNFRGIRTGAVSGVLSVECS